MERRFAFDEQDVAFLPGDRVVTDAFGDDEHLAFGQLGRAIIMNPNQVNARVVLPVTRYDDVVHGYPVDMILYGNNYEEVDDEHPIIERFADPATALKVFREGTAMSKGTTTSTGLVHTYFANIFGPAQYKSLHDGT